MGGLQVKTGFDDRSMDDYRKFLRLKSCPQYRWHGEYAVIPDEYAEHVCGVKVSMPSVPYNPNPRLFDYQRDIAALAIRKKKFAAFVECGLGKTLIMLEYARTVYDQIGGRVLIVSPLMVIKQTASEAAKFYGDSLPISVIKASDISKWCESGCGIGITNFEAIREPYSGKLSALIIDESSMLKSQYGAWGLRLIDMGRGVEYKLTLTGTPAPNDRIEYANQAVFLDQVRSVNEFAAKYFVNKGQTSERWQMRPHATKAFFRDMSHWAIFLQSPATYGWKDNCGSIPPINVHIDHIPLTSEQRKAYGKVTGTLCAAQSGGIGDRTKLAQIAKGHHKGKAIATNKDDFIRDLIGKWRSTESTIVWCRYNPEQDSMERVLDAAVSMRGDTPHEQRELMIDSFKAGTVTELISKPKILGFGLNLQRATRQVFSGLQDSYEEFHQCVKRSNRIGSTMPLNVHIPITEIEEPMISTVLAKRHRVMADIEEQEQLFKENRCEH
jgi:superfamily II DNA or RNA helicase